MITKWSVYLDQDLKIMGWVTFLFNALFIKKKKKKKKKEKKEEEEEEEKRALKVMRNLKPEN